MVLWQKESTSHDACHIDLLTEAEKETLQKQFMASMYEGTNKDDDIATELRLDGNKRFKENKWSEAMELYNRSLRYATDGSENISYSYANRSVCFFQLQKYDQCLVDIGLAKKANYPQRLMHKLDDRETKCSKLIGDKSWKPAEKMKLALSFDADEKFPCLANVLEIRNSDDDSGSHIVAKCDIDVGQIVMLDKLFVSNAHNKDQTYCKTCLGSAKNFIPCPNCSDVLFCDEQCMASNSLHAMSCNALRDQIFVTVRLVESILIAVTAFPDVITLAEFVENALATRDFDAPKCSTDIQSKYRSFLKLNYVHDDISDELKRQISWSYQLMMMKMPEVQQRFQSQRDQRFLMHLILQHGLILNKNSALFHIVNYTAPDVSENQPDVSGIWPFQPLLTISCIRNVMVKHAKNQMFVYTVRPVKKGERLLVEDFLKKADSQCKCSKCVPSWTQEDQMRLELEPDYQFFAFFTADDFNDKGKRMILKKILGNLLRKYGQSPWSPQIDWIRKNFDFVMKKEFCEY